MLAMSSFSSPLYFRQNTDPRYANQRQRQPQQFSSHYLPTKKLPTPFLAQHLKLRTSQHITFHRNTIGWVIKTNTPTLNITSPVITSLLATLYLFHYSHPNTETINTTSIPQRNSILQPPHHLPSQQFHYITSHHRIYRHNCTQHSSP